MIRGVLLLTALLGCTSPSPSKQPPDSAAADAVSDVAVAETTASDAALDTSEPRATIQWITPMAGADRVAAFATTADALSVIAYRETAMFGSPVRWWIDKVSTDGKRTRVTGFDPFGPAVLAMDRAGDAFIVYAPAKASDTTCSTKCLRKFGGSEFQVPLERYDYFNGVAALTADGFGGAFIGNRDGALDSAGGPYLAMHADAAGTVNWRLPARAVTESCSLTGICAGGAESIAVDAKANAYVAAFDAPLKDFKSVTIHKLTPGGAPVWRKTARSADAAMKACAAVAVTDSGSAILVGTARDKVSIDGKALDPGVFVVRLGDTGDVRWTRSIPFASAEGDGCFTPRVVSDRVYLTGTLFGGLVLGGKTITASPSAIAYVALADDGSIVDGQVLIENRGPLGPAAFGTAGASILVAAEYTAGATLLGMPAPASANVLIARIGL